MIIEETFKLSGGAIATVGAVAVAPLLLPGIARLGRPTVKTVIKGAFIVGDAASQAANWVSEVAHETQEQLSDVVAEVKAERAAATKVKSSRSAPRPNRNSRRSHSTGRRSRRVATA